MHTRQRFTIDEVEFVSSGPREQERGLLGFVAFRLNGGLRISGVALRRIANGRRALSFPGRTDSAGTQRFYVQPLDDRTRKEIEAGVFAALGIDLAGATGERRQ